MSIRVLVFVAFVAGMFAEFIIQECFKHRHGRQG